MIIDKTKNSLPICIQLKLLQIHKFLYDINRLDYCKKLESIAYLFCALDNESSNAYLILSYRGSKTMEHGESYLSMNPALKNQLVNSLIDNFNNEMVAIKNTLPECLQAIFPE